MKPIQIISQDVFDKIRSRFQNLEMGDETGAVTINPAEARFFDFDFVNEGYNLGRVSISLQDAGSLKIYYSQGITENQDEPAKKIWYNFLKEMRLFAMRRLMRFDTRDIAKTNLDQNDFQFLANKGNAEDNEMTSMNESKWNNRSTKKTSRAVKGHTEVIVRHNTAVDEMYPGARSQPKKIKAIFIQNSDGERFKYPFIHPAGAFAMAQHVDHGGVPHDPAGKAIIGMSEQIAQLQQFHKHINRASLHDDAMQIGERAYTKLQELKRHIDSLGKRHHYQAWRKLFDESPVEDSTMDLDAVTMETYKQKFTETNFKEDLVQFFPLIHKIMSEVNEIDLEEYVKENNNYCDKCDRPMDQCICHENDKGYNAFESFESWAEAVEQGKLTDDQVEALKQAIEKLQPGELTLKDNGQYAWQFFNEFGIDDDQLEHDLSDSARIDDTTDPLEVFKAWAKKDYPELLVALGMSETEPAPEQEPAENTDMVPPNTQMEGGMDKQAIIKSVAECVMSYYNASNESVGPFRGEEGIAIEAGKKVKEEFGEEAGSMAEELAKQFMKKKTAEWEAKHGPVPGPVEPSGKHSDGLARLKELVGNIKTKVEGIGDQGNGGQDFNKNIMPAESDDKKETPPFDPDPKKQVPHKDQFGNTIKDKNMAKHMAKQGMKQAMDAKEEILKLAGLVK